jgi:hypothetical protein
MRITFDVDYYQNPRGEGETWSHKYSETWEPTEYYCPACGKQSVWMESYGGDYYVGERHLCIGCNVSFYLPEGVDRNTNRQIQQRLKNIREVLECATQA